MGNYGKPGQKPWETMEQYWLNLDENKLRLFQICELVGNVMIQTICGCGH